MIHIDATEFLNGMQALMADQVEAVTHALVGVAESARDQISTIAQQKLSKKNAEKYILGLKDPLEVQPGSVTLTLSGDFPNMMESGFEGFDMKPGLLASPKAVTGKLSKYIDIGFEYSKKSTGEKGLQALSPQAARSLGKAVQAGKEKLGKGKSGTFKARGAKFAPEKSGWKTSQFSNVQQDVAVKGGRISSSSTPATVRRISDQASDPGAWMHPGLKEDQALGAFPEVEPFIREQLEIALKDILESK